MPRLHAPVLPGGRITAQSFVAAKGDLLVGTGAFSTAVLTAGANDSVLTADSTTATGTKWGPTVAAYTPAITWPGNTIAGATGRYIHLPGVLLLWVSFQETAGIATATLTIPLPAGYTAVTMAGSLAAGCGIVGSAGGVNYSMSIAAAGASVISHATAVGSVNTWFGVFTVPTTT